MTTPRARTLRLPTGQTIALSELRRLIREQRPTMPEPSAAATAAAPKAISTW